MRPGTAAYDTFHAVGGVERLCVVVLDTQNIVLPMAVEVDECQYPRRCFVHVGYYHNPCRGGVDDPPHGTRC